MKIIVHLLFSFSVVMLFSCNDHDNAAHPDKTSNDPVKIDNLGVAINYTDSKTGDTALIFIHGWGINHSYWASQVPYFSGHYRVITLDLPGFGQSGKNRNTWTVEDYTRDIGAILKQLAIKKAILVGHSMSGSIIVESALTYPDQVIGIVGIDNLKEIGLVVTPQMQKEWDAFYDTARKNFKPVISENMQGLFAPSTADSIKKRVTDDITGSDPAIAIACLQNLDKYPFVQKLQSLHKTIYLVNSDHTPTDMLAFQKNNISFRLLNVGPTGHYPMLEKPGVFNSLLQKAIAEMK